MLKRTVEKFESFNVCKLYEDGMSLRELERLIGSDRNDIKKYLCYNGVKLRGGAKDIVPAFNLTCSCKGEWWFDYTVFDIIDTEEKAYWLGFMYADGYVSDKTNSISLGLQAKDVGHLHAFSRFLKCTINHVNYCPKVTSGKVYDLYRLEVFSDHMKETLIQKGCTPRKSTTLTFPDEHIVPSDLIRHFIRGYFEGDGCVCFTNRTHIVSLLGTYDFLDGVKCISKCFGNANPIKAGKRSVYTVGKNNRGSIAFLHYMYDGAIIYLERKHSKAMQYIEYYDIIHPNK